MQAYEKRKWRLEASAKRQLFPLHSMIKFIKVFRKGISMSLSGDMAYKWNFYIKSFATILGDFVGPLLTLLIYSASDGIPGWGFYEFLLFQGTLIIVFGLGRTFTIVLPYDVIHAVREGEFDMYLIKPFNTLLYLFSTSVLIEGFSEVFMGIIIVGFCMFQLGMTVFSLNFLAYLILLAAAFMVQCAAMIMISSLAFLVVRSEALMQLYFKISDFVRYPLNVYTVGISFFLTFMFPLAVSSFYPAMVLLQGVNLGIMLKAIIPVAMFSIAALLLWNLAMKSYTSAGG